VLIAFDALHVRGRDITSKPLSYRRRVLEEEIAGSSVVPPALRLEADGLAAWDQVKQSGWEGLVAKDVSSGYRGGATRAWLKVKVRQEGRFIVIGLDVPLAGACSLLLAAQQVRRLVYVGRVEWGVTRAMVATLREASQVRQTPACAGRRARKAWCGWSRPPPSR
jgi:bifunctional non-homologous end joining protein LigD